MMAGKKREFLKLLVGAKKSYLGLIADMKKEMGAMKGRAETIVGDLQNSLN